MDAISQLIWADTWQTQRRAGVLTLSRSQRRDPSFTEAADRLFILATDDANFGTLFVALQVRDDGLEIILLTSITSKQSQLTPTHASF